MNNRIANFIQMAVVMAALTVTTAFAQGEPRSGGRFPGVWEAAVTISDCNTGNTVAAFRSIANFNQDGTSLGSTAGIPQSLRTPEHGVWRHVRANIYMFKFKTFSFTPAGAPSGWSIVEHEVALDQDGNSYTSEGTARLFDVNGVQVGQRCSSAVGTRFEL